MALRVPACIADVGNLLKVHKGDFIFLNEVMEDLCKVVQKFHVVSPPVSLIFAFRLLKAFFS